MNYEERYNAALERAKALCNDADTFTIYDITTIFPELEEEMIRKDIISYLRNEKIVKKYISDIEINKWIAWLDKQDDVNEISAEWSEKDEQMILSIEQIMNCASLLNIVPEKIDNIKSWLKSLRPQKQWKPSTAHKREIDDAYLQGICDAKHEIEKQGEQLDPDKVIGWLKTKVYDDSAYGMAMIEQFKKDFQL